MISLQKCATFLLFLGVKSYLTNAQCEQEFDAANSCLTTDLTLSESDACAACINDLGIGDQTTCSDLADVICTGITTCGCGTCQDELETYWSCVVTDATSGQCTGLDCNVDSTPTTVVVPSSTPAPSPASTISTYSPTSIGSSDVCAQQLDAANSCLATELTSSESEVCATCINDLGIGDQTTCNGLAEVICTGITTCGCGTCQDELETYWNCAVTDATSGQCSGLDCNVDSTPTTAVPASSPAPSPASTISTYSPTSIGSSDECMQELDAANSCLATELTSSESDACAICMNDLGIGDQTTCSGLAEVVCTGITTCGCGTCQDELETYWNCALTHATSGQCTGLDCNVDSTPNTNSPTTSPTSSPLSTSSPTPSFSDSNACAQELTAVNNCLRNDLGGSQGDTCATCIRDIDVPEQGGCSDLKDVVCTSIATCECDTCRDELETYFDCVAQDSSSGQCEISCSDEQEQTQRPTLPPLETSAPTKVEENQSDNSGAGQRGIYVGAIGFAITTTLFMVGM